MNMKRVIRPSTGKRQNSCRMLARKLVTSRGDDDNAPSHMAVFRYLKSIDMKPFHVIRKPFKTEQNKEDRLWQGFLTWGPWTPWGSVNGFQGVRER